MHLLSKRHLYLQISFTNDSNCISTQAIIKYAKAQGLSQEYRGETVVTEIVQGLIAIALLPPDKIMDGYAVSSFFF